MGWNFLVDRASPAITEFSPTPEPAALSLGEGEVVLEIERFALTANNVTYASFGDRMGYWNFFPAPDGWGIVPAWGFATVVRSNNAEAPIGLRLYGYLPMGTHLVARLERRGRAFVDIAAHRAPMAAIYNSYSPANDPGPADDYRALLQPLLVTSFLIDEHLSDEDVFGAGQVVLSSASSKTAMGLAWLLRRRGRARVVGLTSMRNREVIADTGCYDQILTYDQVDDLRSDAQSIYIDFAGDAGLTARVHTRLGAGLVKSMVVGGSHWDAPASTTPMTGVRPEFFFAPDHAAARIAAWGGAGFETRFSEAVTAFIKASPWLVINQFDGQEGLAAAWRSVLDGEVSPAHGLIIAP